MNLSLEGKNAIVTGGGSNIGRAIAMRLAASRANVTIADIDLKQAEKTAAEIIALGGVASAVKTDVTSEESVQAMAKQVTSRSGQIHILVNNVGWDIAQPFLQTDRKFWDKVISINYLSTLTCVKVVAPLMIEQGYGRIVNLGSDAGRIGQWGEAVYSGTKGAVIAFTKAVAREIGRYGVTLNVVCPGLTIPINDSSVGENSLWTSGGPMDGYFTPEAKQKAVKDYALRRLGKPDDIANAVLFFASDAASFVTGQTLSVSGGFSMM